MQRDRMASNGEDDDNEDIEALRKAALATLKPKVQPIEQVISSGGPRKQTPEWSELPASVDYPVFADPVPEPSPFPVAQEIAVAQSNLRQQSPSLWRGHPMNGIPDARFKFQGFHTDRRSFPFHPRTSHRSFGDMGRPLYDRGRRLRRGYVANRRSTSLTNVNRGIPVGFPSGPVPMSRHPHPSVVTQPIPVGGNLIVIQPHKSTDGGDNLSQNLQGLVSQRVTKTSNKSTLPPKAASEDPTSQKLKLVLPQDRYHSSQSSLGQQIQKAAPEQEQKKPKDKFSRYDKSDSEDEDDWMDNHSEADNIAEEIDRFLQDDNQDIAMEEKAALTEEKTETALEEHTISTEILNMNSEDEDQVSRQSSPAPSEAESLDLDALANGDPVIGDFEDLDFLVDKEPVSDNVGDTVKLTDKNDIPDGAVFGEESVDKERKTSLSSPSSNPHNSPRANEDDSKKNNQNDLQSIESRTSIAHHSKSSRDKVSHTKSQSPLSNTSPRNRVDKSKGSRSPLPKSRSSFRSRSPVYARTNYLRRLSPKRVADSLRRSPLGRRRSPFSGRSPRRRSFSPSRRNPHHSPSPRRISSPLRQNTSPQRKPVYSRKSASPRGRRHSPDRRSASPHRTYRYRNDSRIRRNYDSSRRNGENFRQVGSSFGGSLSPSSRSRERGRWFDSREKTSSPHRGERRAHGQQHTQSKEISSSSVGNFHGREDPSKGLFMDDKDLEKLSPEERAKIEARRKKFGSREEVKLENAKKTVSLKSIKERKKKDKKSEKGKDDPLDTPLEESQAKKNDKSGISLKALRKKMELKKSKQEESFAEQEIAGTTLDHMDGDSEDSDSGRAWKLEGNNSKPIKSLKSDSRFLNRRFDQVDRYQTKPYKVRDHFRTHHSAIPKARMRRFQDFQKGGDVSDDDSEECIHSSRMGSSVVASGHLKVEIPPEKLRIQIQVSPKEKKKKKTKHKLDFSHVYSVPAKRSLIDDNDAEEEEEEEEKDIVVPKKKAKKKDKKEKKKKSAKETLEDDVTVGDADPTPKPRLSILERLGKKVELDTTERKKKKKKSKHSYLDNAGEKDNLDQHIRKMKLKNAAIELRQKEIQLDKERYG